MRLLELQSDGSIRLTRNLRADAIPPYAILSHTWGDDTQEVTFEDMTQGTGTSKLGYRKIWRCGQQAARDGLRYFWVDTCCIDQSSSAELSESLNSMYTWYEKSSICYAYLEDWHANQTWSELVSLKQGEINLDQEDPSVMLSSLSDGREDNEDPHLSDGYEKMDEGEETTWREGQHLPSSGSLHSPQTHEPVSGRKDVSLLGSVLSENFLTPLRWYTRGWTLQELIAPYRMVFFDSDWTRRGTKSDPTTIQHLSRITGIASSVLSKSPEVALQDICLGQRMSWASYRRTSREEDMAYCLLGIFDVHMPMLYGEGKNAFFRLQEEILKSSTDLSLFAWRDVSPHSQAEAPRGILARHPREFKHLRNCYVPSWSGSLHSDEFAMTNKGLRFNNMFHCARNTTSGGFANCAVADEGWMDLKCFVEDYRRQVIYLRKRFDTFVRLQSSCEVAVPTFAHLCESSVTYVARDVDSDAEQRYQNLLANGIKIRLKSDHPNYFLEIGDAWPPRCFDRRESTIFRSHLASYVGFVKIHLFEWASNTQRIRKAGVTLFVGAVQEIPYTCVVQEAMDPSKLQTLKEMLAENQREDSRGWLDAELARRGSEENPLIECDQENGSLRVSAKCQRRRRLANGSGAQRIAIEVKLAIADERQISRFQDGRA